MKDPKMYFPVQDPNLLQVATLLLWYPTSKTHNPFGGPKQALQALYTLDTGAKCKFLQLKEP